MAKTTPLRRAAVFPLIGQLLLISILLMAPIYRDRKALSSNIAHIWMLEVVSEASFDMHWALFNPEQPPLQVVGSTSLDNLDMLEKLDCRNQGYLTLLQGDYAQARSILSTCRDSKLTRWFTGLANYGQDRECEALDEWGYPEFYTHFLHVGNLFAQEAQSEQAVKLLEIAAKLEPEIADPYVTLGHLFFNIKDYDSASMYYQLALNRRATNSLQLTMARGNLSFIEQNWEKAAIEYHSATQLSPNYPFAFYWLGRSLYELQDYKGAVQAFQSTLSLNHRHADTHYRLSLSLVELEEWDKARRYAQEAVNMSPNNTAYRELVESLQNR